MWMYSYQKNHILEFGNDNEYGNILFFFFCNILFLMWKLLQKQRGWGVPYSVWSCGNGVGKAHTEIHSWFKAWDPRRTERAELCREIRGYDVYKGAEKGICGAFNEPQVFHIEGVGVLMKLVGDEAGETESDLNFILSDLSFSLKRVAIQATRNNQTCNLGFIILAASSPLSGLEMLKWIRTQFALQYRWITFQCQHTHGAFI